MVRWLLISLFVVAGCREEPTIVITFSPQDFAVRPPDLAVARDLAVVADLAPAAAAPPADRCKRDADCVVVEGDCCGCTAGGTARAIGKPRLGGFKKSQAKQCGTVACIQVLSTHPSCQARAACVAGRCVLTPPVPR